MDDEQEAELIRAIYDIVDAEFDVDDVEKALITEAVYSKVKELKE